MRTGQVAGVAAALSAEVGMQPRDVTFPALHAELSRQGYT
jgi:hypothetical protein